MKQSFEEAYEEVFCTDEYFWCGLLDEEERHTRVDKIKKRYKIGKGLDFECEYLEWVLANVPLHLAFVGLTLFY